MTNCYNFTTNITNNHIEHCLDKCIENANVDNIEIYKILNNCFCKCIYNNKLNDITENNNTINEADNFDISFFVIIILLIIFCLYSSIKAKIQSINMNTNEINTNEINTNTNTRIDLEANINYYTIDNSQNLPKYNDIEPKISLPPKYDNITNSKSNYTNELM